MPEFSIGIMSGSSLDGLDMALCSLDETNEDIFWSIHEAQTVPFPDALMQKLKNAPSLKGSELMRFDADFGKYIGNEVKQWIAGKEIQVQYIASHGHTVFHEPSLGFTTQIGSGAHIAFHSGIDTITSFRSADVAAGGQGAPFAPVADRGLFPGYDGYLNLGGIANVNLLANTGQWKAWDIGPCNQALNHLANKLGYRFDADGRIAEAGNDSEDIINLLLEMYPQQSGQPKGLSNKEVQDTWISYLDSSKIKTEDLLASTTEAIILMILNHISALIKTPSKILVTGGGAYNTFLISRLKTLAADFDIEFEIPSSQIIEYKECLLMAYLGYLTMHDRDYGIKNSTGASIDTIGGAIFKAVR